MCPINSDEHDAKHGVRSEPGSRRRWNGVTSRGRHPTNRATKKSSEVM
ncbi:MAG: hypothetical protein WB986_09355 [Methanoregula sp.]